MYAHPPSHYRNEQHVTVLRTPAHWTADLDDPAVNCDRVRMRARWRHQATVFTISGDVDATNGGRVQVFATGFVLLGNALILDLSGIDFFSARGVSMLIAVDDACQTSEVPWALIPSPVVNRVLRLTNCDTVLPIASSVPEALRQVTALTQTRRRLALVTTTAQRQSARRLGTP